MKTVKELIQAHKKGRVIAQVRFSELEYREPSEEERERYQPKLRKGKKLWFDPRHMTGMHAIKLVPLIAVDTACCYIICPHCGQLHTHSNGGGVYRYRLSHCDGAPVRSCVVCPSDKYEIRQFVPSFRDYCDAQGFISPDKMLVAERIQHGTYYMAALKPFDYRQK